MRRNLALSQTSPAPLIAAPEAVLIARAQAGGMRALDALLSRHWSAFLQHARTVCGDPFAAEDICQDACIKAVHRLSRLSNPGSFRSWVFTFIDHETMHWKRDLKKECTRARRVGIHLIQTMSVESVSEVDTETLLELLAQRTLGMPDRRRRAATFMIEQYRLRREFPTIRAIAAAVGVSQGAAQHYRDDVIASWRQFLAGLDPDILPGGFSA